MNKYRCRRVKRVDVDSPQEFESIVEAAQKTGINRSVILKALKTAGSGWVALTPPKNGLNLKVDGIEYPSILQAAEAFDLTPEAFRYYRRKKLATFTIKGHQVEVLSNG
jgi:hypothetical protein